MNTACGSGRSSRTLCGECDGTCRYGRRCAIRVFARLLWQGAYTRPGVTKEPALQLQYAQWEEAQKDFRRARSVWERALDVNPQSITLWLRYAEMEMRGRFVNHARNVWDRAVQVRAWHARIERWHNMDGDTAVSTQSAAYIT